MASDDMLGAGLAAIVAAKALLAKDARSAHTADETGAATDETDVETTRFQARTGRLLGLEKGHRKDADDDKEAEDQPKRECSASDRPNVSSGLDAGDAVRSVHEAERCKV